MKASHITSAIRSGKLTPVHAKPSLRISFPLPHPRRHLLPRLHRAVELLAASRLHPHLAASRCHGPARSGWLTFSTATIAVLILGILFALAAALLRTWGSAYLGASIVQDAAHARRRRRRRRPLPPSAQSALPRHLHPHLRARAPHAAQRSHLLHPRHRPLRNSASSPAKKPSSPPNSANPTSPTAPKSHACFPRSHRESPPPPSQPKLAPRLPRRDLHVGSRRLPSPSSAGATTPSSSSRESSSRSASLSSPAPSSKPESNHGSTR